MGAGRVFWVYFTGVALIAGGVAIIINKMAFEAALCLAALLLIFALTVHLPLLLNGQQLAMISLFKDISMAGAVFFIAGQVKGR